MQLEDSVAPKRSGLGVAKRGTVGTALCLALLLLVVYVHALTSYPLLIDLAAVLGVALVLLSVVTIRAGITYSWVAHPKHRNALAFVVLITVAVLAAHVYVIGLPAAGTPGMVSGTAGSTLSDDKVNVASTVSGQQLTVTVTAKGEAVGQLNITAGGANLPTSGFSSPPTFAYPLMPGNSVTGTWNVASLTGNTTMDVAYQHLTCYSTSSRSYGCIMDEVFYVPEAMGILSGQQCSTSGTNCHMEHPYLAPALIAAGMAVLGQYNSAGWRLFPALLGTFSIPVLFGIAWKVSGDKKIAAISAILFALDVMFFAQSGGALLDAPETFFGLVAVLCLVANVRAWRFDRYMMAGLFLGVASLAKETAIFMLAALFTYVLLFDEGPRRVRVASAMKIMIVTVLVFIAGLQAYDSAMASASVPTFVQHVGYMLSYGSSLIADKLACQPTTGYWCKFPNDGGGPPILPFDWLVYYSPVAYYATSVTVCPNTVNGVCQGGQYSYVALAYYGVTNLLETWTVYIWFPLVAYALYRFFRRSQPVLEEFVQEGEQPAPRTLPGDIRLGALALVWFSWTYFPYIALFFWGRVTYPFYFIPAIPAVALGAAYWTTRDWFPKWLMYIYVAMVFVFFFVYYPDKAFLPDWLRVIIAH